MIHGHGEDTLRAFLSSAHDGGWYIVPANKLEEWDNWKLLPCDDPRSAVIPQGVIRAAGKGAASQGEFEV